MNKQQAQQIIRDTFENSFDKNRFAGFIKNLLNGIDDAPFTYQGNYIPDSYKQYIKTLERIGKFSDGENSIDILVITLQKETSLERARTMQRNFIAWYLNGSRGGEMKDAALAAFVSPGEEDWRFSLVKMVYKFEKSATALSACGDAQAGRMKVKEEFTPARRWSFLVGANEKSHTAQSRLVNILANDEQDPTLAEIEKAFDIETVTKEFFLKYRELFLRTKEELDRVVKKDPEIRADFEAKGVDTVNFAKKLLGQIVFLYFLQKKGWFGVGRDNDWGTGSKHFLRELFEKKHSGYKNFYNDILEPLFYEALRIDRSHDDGYYSRFDCKIPFLNGGLFDPIGNYDWVHTDIIIPDKLFSNTRKTKEGDTGDGILDIFDRFNFTVKEDEPLEKEVAIDPELLGKAYEKFNAIRPDNYDEFRKALKSGKTGEENKFNKKFGVYYTPREIVHYMCQQSLINYLSACLAQAGLATELTDCHSRSSLSGNPVVSKEDIETLIHTGDQVSENEVAALIKEQNIKEGKQKTSEYKLQLPESIRSNAALIDEKLADITVCDPAVGSGAFPVGMMSEIVRARNVLSVFLDDNSRTSYEFKRRCIEHSLYGVDIDPGAVEIAKLRLWLSLMVNEDDIKNIKPLPNLDYKIVCGNSLLGVEKDLFNATLFSELERLKPLFFNETNPTKKQEYKKQIDKLISEITSGHTEFDFEVYFSEVFHNKGGFDVVIANPPYYSLEVANKYTKESLKRISKVFAGKADICYFFFESGINLLNSQGVISFITSRYFIEATYAKLLRAYIIKHTSIVELFDFQNCSIFEGVGIHNAITILTKNRRINGAKINIFKNMIDKAIMSRDNYKVFTKKISSRNWLLTDCREDEIFSKASHNAKPLGEIASIEQGQKSGLNRVFCVDNVFASKLEKAPLKKLIKNSHIHKYFIDYKNLYLIYTSDNFKLNNYPKIKAYLEKHKKELKNRAEAKDNLYHWYRLQRPRKESLFSVAEKIVVPYRAEYNKFAYDDQKYFNDGGDIRIIVINDSLDLETKYCLAILNSKFMNFYYQFIGRKKGNVYEYFGEPLSKIPIKIVSKKNQKPLIAIVDHILAITKSDDYLQNSQKQAKVKALEREIDQLVYKLYDLTEDEIKIVESSL